MMIPTRSSVFLALSFLMLSASAAPARKSKMSKGASTVLNLMGLQKATGNTQVPMNCVPLTPQALTKLNGWKDVQKKIRKKWGKGKYRISTKPRGKKGKKPKYPPPLLCVPKETKQKMIAASNSTRLPKNGGKCKTKKQFTKWKKVGKERQTYFQALLQAEGVLESFWFLLRIWQIQDWPERKGSRVQATGPSSSRSSSQDQVQEHRCQG
jgi:hypothetical protein